MYGAIKQFTADTDTSAPLDNTSILHVYCIVGAVLYYAQSVDCTMICILGSLASQQANPTQNIMKKVKIALKQTLQIFLKQLN